MAAVKGRQVLCCVLLLLVFSLVSSAYKAPKVTFEIFSPRGLKVSIPDDPAIQYFEFNGNVDQPIFSNEKGTINGKVLFSKNGRWGFVDTKTKLLIGDIINYYIKLDIFNFNTSNTVYYLKDNLRYTVTSFVNRSIESTNTNWSKLNTKPPNIDTELTNINWSILNTKPTTAKPTTSKPTTARPTTTKPTTAKPTTTKPTTAKPTSTNTEPSNITPTNTEHTNCFPTITEVRGAKACRGQIIFEDDFTSLREDVWQIEQYLPVSWHPEYPFVSYQKLPDNPVVSVSDGYLRITPMLQQNIPGFTNESIFLGSLGCTSRAEECYRQASGPDILPPVVSGRLTSSGFTFKYGIVKVRARLPLGDWLYPEILLEPFLKKYGSSNYASGILKIATARGNRELRVGNQEFGNSVLYGGPVMDVQCRMQLMSLRRKNGGRWGDQFYEYSVTWTPQYIALSVDGEEWSRVYASGGLSERFPNTCTHLPWALLEKGTDIAPFDDYFYITLGVAAGGITEFPDESFSEIASKPWRNSARKGMLNFWEHLSSWHPTWTQPEMLVDYVRVIAL